MKNNKPRDLKQFPSLPSKNILVMEQRALWL